MIYELTHEGYRLGLFPTEAEARHHAATPDGEMISNGDVIDWVTESGRRFHGVIDEANNVKIELDGSWVTEIEIKQGTGD